MVRVGGMGYSIDVAKPVGERISNMTLLKTGAPIEPTGKYIVGGWASINEETEGPAIYDVVSDYLRKEKVVKIPENNNIKVNET